jgi:[ribosomal protein S18]-alanine N-acetyltransferase
MQPTTTPSLRFRPFTPEDALIVASWRYPEPYAAYDLDPWDRGVLTALLRPENRYHTLLEEDEVVGFFCLGEDARVPGGDYTAAALDFGMGLRPDLTGAGRGPLYLRAVLAWLEGQHPGTPLRATVAGWNQRALKLCRSMGFAEVARFHGTRNPQTEYVVLERVAGRLAT